MPGTIHCIQPPSFSSSATLAYDATTLYVPFSPSVEGWSIERVFENDVGGQRWSWQKVRIVNIVTNELDVRRELAGEIEEPGTGPSGKVCDFVSMGSKQWWPGWMSSG